MWNFIIHRKYKIKSTNKTQHTKKSKISQILKQFLISLNPHKNNNKKKKEKLNILQKGKTQKKNS